MEKVPFYKVFGLWAKSRFLLLIFYILFALIIFVVYSLYGIDYGAVLYALLLASVLGLCFGCADFVRFSARYTALTDAAAHLPVQQLPAARNSIEDMYQNIIWSYESDRKDLQQQLSTIKTQSTDYYTLWAHQIKTPLSAMRLVLQKEDAGSMPKETRDVLETELFRTEQYVDMVLQYQRLYSFHSDLDLREYPVEQLVRTAVKNLAPLFIYKKLPVCIGDMKQSVVTDAKWFVFVLEQLLTNAIKYTAQGEIGIFYENNGLVIQDTGIGIRPEDLPLIFERGYTGVTGRGSARSTGIGLYLCRQILDKLGFNISVDSRIGTGTRVVIDLRQQRISAD